MNMKCVLSAVAVLSSLAVQAFEVVNVTASQRWPWHNLVDVDYEITGAAVGEAFRIDLTASSSGGTKTYCASTYRTEPVGATGENRITWDFGADFPDVRATDMQVSVTATPLKPNSEIYCVIDLSSGPASLKYPVRYTLVGPKHVKGAFDEPCQTTEMWLKRVQKGTYNFGSKQGDYGGVFTAKLTKDFYFAIFECTQQQWALVTGKWPSAFTNVAARASRPVETIYLDDLIGHWNWPDKKTISVSSFVGLMRARTGLATFNLPTEAQWEYALRAGNPNQQIAPDGHLYEYGRFDENGGNPSSIKTYNETPDVGGTAFVGSYEKNDWGFYDVCGNVCEWCLDSFVDTATLKKLYKPQMDSVGFVEDPLGPANSASGGEIHSPSTQDHSWRGGNWSKGSVQCLSTARYNTASKRINESGARFCFTCE